MIKGKNTFVEQHDWIEANRKNKILLKLFGKKGVNEKNGGLNYHFWSLKYTKMPKKERALVEQKVANPSLYLKSICAVYEVYKGHGILRNFFRVVQ